MSNIDSSADKPPAISLHQLLDAQLTPVVQFMVNGIIVSFQGLPLDRVLSRLCRIFGMVVGACVSSGDLASALRVRNQFRGAFDEGLKAVTFAQPTAANHVVKQPRHVNGKT